jgi:hypothetical protein
MRTKILVVVASLIMGLTGCGSGGGSSTPAPANNNPTGTNPATSTVTKFTADLVVGKNITCSYPGNVKNFTASQLTADGKLVVVENRDVDRKINNVWTKVSVEYTFTYNLAKAFDNYWVVGAANKVAPNQYDIQDNNTSNQYWFSGPNGPTNAQAFQDNPSKFYYDQQCAGCHALGSYDTTGTNDLSGKSGGVTATVWRVTDHHGAYFTSDMETDALAAFMAKY